MTLFFIKKIVVVINVERGSLAEMAYIHEGSIILQVNHVNISNVSEFNREMKRSEKNGVALLLVKDRGYARYITLNL